MEEKVEENFEGFTPGDYDDDEKDEEINEKEDNDKFDIEEMKKKLAMMQAEAEKLSKIQAESENDIPPLASSVEDERSVYVGNVEYETTPKQLQEFFADCGIIARVTILTNKFTGRPMGYGYVEFAEKESVEIALEKDGKEFNGRNLKVRKKRSNFPGMGKRGRRGRGRGGRRRGRGRGRRRRGRGRGRFRYRY